jgi:hypothetical protein
VVVEKKNENQIQGKLKKQIAVVSKIPVKFKINL